MEPNDSTDREERRDRAVGGRPGKRDSESPRAGRVLKWVGGALAGIVILYLGAALALRTLVPPETVAAWAEPRAEAALNRDVEIEGAELTIFPHLGIVLEGPSVGNLAGFQGPPVARAERAELLVAPWPLVRGDVVVDEAVARGLDVRLQVDEDGDTNYGDLLPASQEPDAAAAGEDVPVSLAVRSVGVSGSRMEYRDRRTGRLLVLDGLEVRGSLSRGDAGWVLETDADAGDVTATFPSLREAPMRPGSATLGLRMQAGPGFGRVEVGEGRLAVGGVPLSVTGRVDSLKAPVRRLSLSLDADSLDLASLAGSAPAGAVPDAVESLTGVATVQIGVTGPLGEGAMPDVSGQLRLRGLGATLADRGQVARGVGALLRLRGDTLDVEDMEGTVLGGPFRMSGSLTLDSARSFSGSVESTISVAALGAPDASTGPTGTVETSLDLSGEASRPAAASAGGSVVLRDVVVPADSPRSPIRIPRGELSFVGQAITWSSLTVAIGEDRITTTGRLDRWGGFLAEDADLPAIRARAESERLDLARLLPQPDGSPTYGQLVFARLGSDSVAGGSTAEVARELGYVRPPSLPVTGELELTADTLLFSPYRFRPMTARLEFGPDLIRIPGAEFGLFGGTLEMSLSASLGDAEEQPFSASITGRGLRAGDFLATSSPMGRLLTGTMSLDLEAAGRLDGALLPVRDSLLGSGRFAMDGGGLSQNPVTSAMADMLTYPALRSPSVKRMVVPFQLEGTRVRFDTARLAAPAAEASWVGSMDLDGSLDLGAAIEVPRSRVPELSLKGTDLPGELLSRIKQGEGPLQLGLGVGGTVASPRVGLDTDALRARATEATREAVQKKIDRGQNVLEKRARGMLQRLTGGGDTASADTAAASDTAAADTTGAR